MAYANSFAEGKWVALQAKFIAPLAAHKHQFIKHYKLLIQTINIQDLLSACEGDLDFAVRQLFDGGHFVLCRHGEQEGGETALFRIFHRTEHGDGFMEIALVSAVIPTLIDGRGLGRDGFQGDLAFAFVHGDHHKFVFSSKIRDRGLFIAVKHSDLCGIEMEKEIKGMGLSVR